MTYKLLVTAIVIRILAEIDFMVICINIVSGGIGNMAPNNYSDISPKFYVNIKNHPEGRELVSL